MLKDRDVVNKFLHKIIFNYNKNEDIASVIKEIIDKHNMSREYLSDIFTMNIQFEDLTDFDVFCVIETISNASLKKYFTEQEIKRYSKEKYAKAKPIKTVTFDVIRVAEDQYIGAYSVKKLMQLRQQRLINYNVNTQRAMSYVINHGNETYKIAINNVAVKQIRESLKSGIYIPNTITLNINEETDMVYSYKDGKLTINSVQPFDIIDGYHRYLAMAQEYTEDNSFDYPVELRVVIFSESRAKQFIYQEDQKTKMPKLSSDSMNQYDYNNMVCKRLNTESVFAGDVHTNGKIEAGVFASLLSVFGIKERSDIIKVSNQFKTYFEDALVTYPDILDKRWNKHQTQSFVYSVYKQMDIDETIKLFKFFEKTPSDIKQRFSRKWVLHPHDQAIIEEVRTYV